MALQVDSQDQIQEVLGVLKRRRWTIVLPALYVIAIGLVVAIFAPKRFVAEMTINLLEARASNRSYGSGSLQESATQREIENAEYQAKSYERVRRVIEELNWVDYLQLPDIGRHEYLLRLRERIDVNVAAKQGDEGSTFVDLSYSDVDRDRAIRFLERLTMLWVTEVYERDAENLREERETYRKLRDEARREFERLERERAQLITDNDLTPAQVDGDSRGRDEDPVQLALNDRRAEVEDLETQIEELSTEVRGLREMVDSMPRDVLTPVAGATNYELQIKQLETEVQALLLKQAPYLPAHTEWQNIQDLLDQRESQINSLRDAARQVTLTGTRELNLKRVERADQLAQSELELAKLTARRDRLEQLNREDARAIETRINALSRVRELDAEIEAARANLQDAALALFDREKLLRVLQEAYSQPWLVTQEATAKDRPTEPNVAIVVVLAIILGLGLGVVSAVAAEFLRPGMRTPGDAARAIDLPVLGLVGEFQTRAQRRARAARAAAVGLSTVLILGGLGWFTWTWSERPELLSTGVLEAIEGVRREFR
jgi:uncharacterized protein involved in exopolysaccharide biosynthesis